MFTHNIPNSFVTPYISVQLLTFEFLTVLDIYDQPFLFLFSCNLSLFGNKLYLSRYILHQLYSAELTWSSVFDIHFVLNYCSMSENSIVCIL